MDFAPYQSSPPEHSRPFSPPRDSAASPRTSLERAQRPFSPPFSSATSPPPLQHPQPQRQWAPQSNFNGAGGGGSGGGGGGYGFAGGLGGFGGGLGEARDGVSEFDTSLGIRLDYEACLAYLLLPPLGAIVMLILEKKSDYVRFHAWQSSLLFTVLLVLHLIFSGSTFLTWVLILADIALLAWLVMRAYRDADTLDRNEVPVFGQIASRILDDE